MRPQPCRSTRPSCDRCVTVRPLAVFLACSANLALAPKWMGDELRAERPRTGDTRRNSPSCPQEGDAAVCHQQRSVDGAQVPAPARQTVAHHERRPGLHAAGSTTHFAAADGDGLDPSDSRRCGDRPQRPGSTGAHEPTLRRRDRPVCRFAGAHDRRRLRALRLADRSAGGAALPRLPSPTCRRHVLARRENADPRRISHDPAPHDRSRCTRDHRFGAGPITDSFRDRARPSS